MFSVLIPVKETSKTLPKVLQRLEEMKKAIPYLIGEILIERQGTLPEARKALCERSCFHYVLNLDADTLIDKDYLTAANKLLMVHPRIGAIAVDYYNKPQGHPAFGTSIMSRNIMNYYYDWKSIKENGTCECLYTWQKLISEGYIIATLPLMAKHLR